VFFKGFVLGFSIAAPVGPIGLLCIQRTLARGRLRGIVSGLGAATADAVYGLIAAFGLTAVTQALLGAQFWLQLAGGVFLVGLGIRTLGTQPAAGPSPGDSAASGHAAAWLSVFVLTLANPATILSFLAVFAGLGVANPAGGPGGALALVAGVFLGSAAWWGVLGFVTGLLRHQIGARGLRAVNLFSGASIVTLGIWSLVTLVRGT